MGGEDSTKLSVQAEESEDFGPILIDILQSVNYKFYGLMFLTFMVITSEEYITRILSRIEGALEYQIPTTYGAMIQALSLVMVMLIVHMLIHKEVI